MGAILASQCILYIVVDHGVQSSADILKRLALCGKVEVQAQGDPQAGGLALGVATQFPLGDFPNHLRSLGPDG